MKKTLFAAALAVVSVLTACKDNTPKQFDGVIVKSSADTVAVKEMTGDQTYVFTLENADTAEANGLLIGNLISVTYVGKISEVTPATKVSTDPTYAKAVGKWIMTDPADSLNIMGVELMTEGKAASINMATLPVESWELQGEADKITLHGKSIGNGQTIDFTQTGTIVEQDSCTVLNFGGFSLTKEK